MRRLSALLLLAALTAVVTQTRGQDAPAPDENLKLTLAIDPGTHHSSIRRVFFRDKGKQMVTVGGDQTVRLWDVAGLQPTKVIHLPGFCLAYSSDGTPAIAALSADGNQIAVSVLHPEGGKEVPVIYVISLPDGKIRRALFGHDRTATSMGFSGDGDRLVSASNIYPDSGLRLWDLNVKGEKGSRWIDTNNTRQSDVAFSPDGKRVAYVAGNAGGILDLKTMKQVAPLWGSHVAWSPDGTTIATAWGGELRLHDAGGKEIAKRSSLAGCVSLKFSGDSQSIVWNGTLLLDAGNGWTWWDLDQEPTRPAQQFGTADGAVAPGGDLAAAVGYLDSSWIHLYDIKTRQLRHAIRQRPWFTGGAARVTNRWSKDGRSVCWRHHELDNRDFEFRFGTFRFDKLELAPTLKEEDRAPEVSLREGAYSLKINPRGQNDEIVKGGKAIHQVHGSDPTFVGEERVATVALYTRWGINVYDAPTGKVIRYLHNVSDFEYSPRLSPSPKARYLSSLQMDQSLQVWSLEQSRPLLTLYKNGPDWVVWTQEGYFAATAGGEKMVSWKIDNGVGKMPTVIGVDRIGKRMRRPDVIRKAFELGSVKAALKELDGGGKKDVAPEKIDELLPPAVELRVVNQDKDDGTVEVEVVAKARAKGQPVTALRLMLDGLPFPDLEAKVFDKPEAEPKPWTVKVKIRPGQHTLGALARSADASSRADPVSVVWEAEPNRPVLHVLAVGIDKYTNGLRELGCAAKDATDIDGVFAATKKQGRLFKDVQTHLLTDKNATAKAVRDKLAELADREKGVKREDVVVVFFAGHGTVSGGDFYFLTVDSDPAKLSDENALSGKSLAGSLGGLRCRVLLLLDACHSGAADLKPASEDAARALADDEVGVTVLSATMGKQTAIARKNNGLFTLALKEAIEGTGKKPAPRDADGRVFVYHLYAHASERVAELSDHKQNPLIRPPDGVPPFAIRQFDKK